jgi:integrase
LQNLKLDEQKVQVEKNNKTINFFSIWEQLINSTKNAQGKPITKGTKQSKKQTKNLLERYCQAKKIELSFEKIDMAFYHDFDEYMIAQKLCDNTRGRHFKEIKAILREATDRDIPVNNSYLKKRFKVIRTQPDNVYLNDVEIKKIFNLKLTESQERLKDLFVMACYVGARHSDWKQICKKNIVMEGEKEMLKIKQKKTGSIVHIPIHSAVKSILIKYDGNPPSVITNQKFNEALKVICKKAELGCVIIDNMETEKWTQITTHTARRSFATNAYLSRSMDVYQIMKCTGHKTESSFNKYLGHQRSDFYV